MDGPVSQGLSRTFGNSSVQLSIRYCSVAAECLDEIGGSVPKYVGGHEAR
jgi:hypothetical protein